MNMIEDTGATDAPLPVPSLSAPVIRKTLEWCELHAQDEDGLSPVDREAPIDPRDAAFYETVGDEMLFLLVLAANYLEIKPMLELACRMVAVRTIKGKTPDELRAIHGITGPFTEAEVETLKEAGEWID